MSKANVNGVELYKFASTLFLGIGIAAVLQGRLVPDSPDFPIPPKARRFWANVDAGASAALLVIVATGEFLAVRSIVHGHPSPDDRHITIVLLFLTAGYVIAQTLLRRGLALAWVCPGGADPCDNPTKDSLAITRFVGSLVLGGILGGAIFAAVAFNNWQLLIFWAVAALVPLVEQRLTRDSAASTPES